MKLGTFVPNHKELTKTKKLNQYNNPKYIYIPLICGGDTNITVLVKKGDYVRKGTKVGKRKGNLSLPIHSSISGTVIDFEEKTVYNGSKVKCIVIENDFKEKLEKTDHQNQYTKETFIELLKDTGIRGMGGADFPTYIKYSTPSIKTLIVNAVECEPYITCDYFVLKNNITSILESIDTIMEINNIEEAYIAFKKDNELKKLINTYLGTYPKIHIKEVPNLYPIGYERNLVKYIKKIEYDRLPIEKGIVINNVSTIYSIYEALTIGKPLIERTITFSGEMFKNPANYTLKIGTSIKDIINDLGIKKDNVILVSGGPMMGEAMPSDDLIVTSNLNCVLALPKKASKSIDCLRCGKCINVCPSHLCPVLIKDYINDIERLKELNVDKCIECGLCSYVCPSSILVREYVRLAKTKLRNEVR